MSETFVISNAGKASIVKDPDAVLDYSWDWSDWLDDIGDSIASANVLVSGVTKDSQSVSAGVVTAFLSGGTRDTYATATCRIVTAGGRTEDRTFTLKIRDR